MARPPTALGNDPQRPLVIGRENGARARYIESTGLAHGIAKGRQKWVTGTRVEDAVAAGLFIEIDHPLAEALTTNADALGKTVVVFDPTTDEVTLHCSDIEPGAYEEMDRVREVIAALAASTGISLESTGFGPGAPGEPAGNGQRGSGTVRADAAEEQEPTVEIGGQVMTQAQYDAARFPLLHPAPKKVAKAKAPAKAGVKKAGAKGRSKATAASATGTQAEEVSGRIAGSSPAPPQPPAAPENYDDVEVINPGLAYNVLDE